MVEKDDTLYEVNKHVTQWGTAVHRFQLICLKTMFLFSQTRPFVCTSLFLLRAPCCLYLGSWLEDPELLCWRQRCVQRDDYHGTAAVGQMLGNVPARPRQSLDLLLTRHED